MNVASFLSDITGDTEQSVRVWFSRKQKSINDTDAVREYLIHKLQPKITRSDKGKKRAVPWLEGYKFGSTAEKPERKDEVLRGEYYYKYVPTHPRADVSGYVKRCNLVVEEAMGRYLESDELVHHKNGTKYDDSLSNLQVCTKKEHIKIHNAMRNATISKTRRTL